MVEQYYGKDCPHGMVQVEFVGIDPALRYSPYGWKPAKDAWLDVYIDGQRFRITLGDFHDGRAHRRGIHVVGPVNLCSEQTSLNAVSLYVPPNTGRSTI